MIQPAQYVCDVCKRQKGDVNHWFLASRTVDGLKLTRWTDVEAPVATMHLCSEQCTHRAVSAYLQER